MSGSRPPDDSDPSGSGIPASPGPVEETENRIMPAPARGTATAAVLIAGSAIAIALAYAHGSFLLSHPGTAGAAPAAADPAQLLARIAVSIGVICGVATLTGQLFRRAGQPPVVGEIVGGLLLGPSALGLLAPGLPHALVAPQVMPYVSLAAQAGLAIFMYTVGAEFDTTLLRRQPGVIGAASLAMMALPFTLGALIAVPMASSFAGPSAAPATFALFIGAALSVTAFPVLGRIVQDTGLRGTRLGALAVLCAALADVLAWCMVAVVLAMTRSAGPAGALRSLGLTAALSVVCVAGLRPLARMLTARYAGAALPGPARLVTVIAVIIALSAATDRIGVHAIFGGFLAGLLLPGEDPLFGAAARQLGAMNRVVLVPVFFASVGMQADVRLVFSHPAVLAGGALLIVAAVAGKLGSAVPVGWAGGMPGRTALGLGVLMNTRGVTEIVVLSIGLSAGLINEAAFTVLVLMALLTTCVAVPALRYLGLVRAGERRSGAPAQRAGPAAVRPPGRRPGPESGTGPGPGPREMESTHGDS